MKDIIGKQILLTDSEHNFGDPVKVYVSEADERKGITLCSSEECEINGMKIEKDEWIIIEVGPENESLINLPGAEEKQLKRIAKLADIIRTEEIVDIAKVDD